MILSFFEIFDYHVKLNLTIWNKYLHIIITIISLIDVKIQPNNVEEDGIVVTQGIANILEKMKSKRVVMLSVVVP